MSADVVLSEALAEVTSDIPLTDDVPAVQVMMLTRREREVLRLVTQGLTDPEIATQLYLSRRTVSWHLTSIYRKLGVRSRAAATRLAIEHKLL